MAFIKTIVRAPAAGLAGRGMGEYDKVANWSWLYFPPPYDSVDPQPLTPAANFYAPAKSMRMGGYGSGLGCGCGCNGAPGGCGQSQGMGALTSGEQTGLVIGGLVLAAGIAWRFMGKKGRR